MATTTVLDIDLTADDAESPAAALESALAEALSEWSPDFDNSGVVSVSSYEEAGVMTRDRGLVLRLRDGAEFQITLVQSRYGAGEEN